MTHDMSYMEISPSGELLFEIPFMNKYLCMMHDFGDDRGLCRVERHALHHQHGAAGEAHALFRLRPFAADLARRVAAQGRARRAADMRWFKAPTNCFTGHVMNAFNDGTKVYFDLPIAEKNSFPFFPDVTGAPFDPIGGMSYLTRWTVDMSSNCEEFESVETDDQSRRRIPAHRRSLCGPALSPWLDARLRSPRSPTKGRGGPFVGVINSLCPYRPGDRARPRAGGRARQCGIQEPCFIPKSADAPEGEGYVVASSTITSPTFGAVLLRRPARR